MISDLKRVIDQVSREKGVDRNVLVQTLEEAVKAAARKKWGPNYDMEVTYNDEAGEIEVFEFKTVVEKVTNEHVEISMEEAHQVDPESEPGDSLGIKMDTDEFGRIAAQSAKQVIMQRLREAERGNVYTDFKDRKGEIVHGIVQRFDKGAIIVNLGRTEAELPIKEQIPKESYKQGDRIRAYICDVKQFSKGAQVILSRTTPLSSPPSLEMKFLKLPKGLSRLPRWPENRGAVPKSRSPQGLATWTPWGLVWE
jgi:N utilization substance protein A